MLGIARNSTQRDHVMKFCIKVSRPRHVPPVPFVDLKIFSTQTTIDNFVSLTIISKSYLYANTVFRLHAINRAHIFTHSAHL